MAAVVLVALAVGLQKAHDKVQQARSPNLPPRPGSSTDSHEGNAPLPPLSYAGLKELLYLWADRENALTLIQRDLMRAMSRGLTHSWAGSVSSLPAVKAAREEARWVVQRLAEARRFCKERGVREKRNKYHKIKDPKQTLDEYPPSLLDLPDPIPAPPSLAHLAPVVQLPPSITADHGVDDLAGDVNLPAYSTELKVGEKKLQSTRAS